MTPCTGYCILGVDEVCGGCYRTLHEIAIWYKSNDEARLKILEEVKKRKT